jgi:hypothetical protein
MRPTFARHPPTRAGYGLAGGDRTRGDAAVVYNGDGLDQAETETEAPLGAARIDPKQPIPDPGDGFGDIWSGPTPQLACGANALITSCHREGQRPHALRPSPVTHFSHLPLLQTIDLPP